MGEVVRVDAAEIEILVIGVGGRDEVTYLAWHYHDGVRDGEAQPFAGGGILLVCWCSV